VQLGLGWVFVGFYCWARWVFLGIYPGVQTLHSLAHVLLCVCVQLIEFLSDQNELAAADVLVFVREATQRFEQLRPVIVSKLLDTFPSIKSLKYDILSTMCLIFLNKY